MMLSKTLNRSGGLNVVSFSGRLKAPSNHGVKRQGLCAVFHCQVQAVGTVELVPLCEYHRYRADELGTVSNPCRGTACTRDAERIMSAIGPMLCRTHEHMRWTLGFTGPWNSSTEPDLLGLDLSKVLAHERAGEDQLERFMGSLVEDPETGCWLWTGTTTHGGNGGGEYGRFYADGKAPWAHVWAWEHVAGLPRDRNLVIDHICRVPLCQRPGHMQQITNEENLALARQRKLEPPAGYEMKPPNRTLTMQEFTLGIAYNLPVVNHEADILYPEGWSRV